MRTVNAIRLGARVKWRDIFRRLGVIGHPRLVQRKLVSGLSKHHVMAAAHGKGPLASWLTDAALLSVIRDEAKGLQTDLEDFVSPTQRDQSHDTSSD